MNEIDESPTPESPTPESLASESPISESPNMESPVIESPTAESPVTESSIAEAPPITLDESYKLCKKIAREQLGEYAWTISNLPRDQRKHIHALMAFLAQAMELLDIRVSRVVRSDEWLEWRDELRETLRRQKIRPEMLALVDTVEQFEISREFLFDIQAGVELAIRCESFDTFDQWLQLASRIGGSLMLAVVPVLGYDEPGYEEAAMACGEAIFLTQLIDQMGSGHHEIIQFAPRDDAQRCDVDLEALNPKKPGLEFARFIRGLVSQVEPIFQKGGKLIHFMSFDGKRVFRTMIAMHWTLLMKMKVDPAGVLQNKHQLTAKDMFHLRFKHLMGLEGGVPVIEEGQHTH